MTDAFVPPDGLDPVVSGVGVFAGAFGLAFVGFGILFVAAVVFIIVVIVRNARAARAAGYDPLTMQTQMATRVMDSALLQPAQTTGGQGDVRAQPAPSIEARLAELDDLVARGVITDAERTTARAAILAG